MRDLEAMQDIRIYIHTYIHTYRLAVSDLEAMQDIPEGVPAQQLCFEDLGVCVCVYVCVCVCVCMQARILFVCVCSLVCMYVCIHTYIHATHPGRSACPTAVY